MNSAGEQRAIPPQSDGPGTSFSVIGLEKVEDFQQTYKDADEYCCLFVLDEEFTNFVYVPYPED